MNALILLPILGAWSAFWSRIEGAGSTIWPTRPPQLSAAMFSLPIAVVGLFTFIGHGLHHLIGWPIALIIMWACALGWMQTGHGTFYFMRGFQGDDPIVKNMGTPDRPRMERLDILLQPLYIRLGGDIHKPLYSWVMMGVKGFLIHLPLGLYAPFAAFLWPFSYWLGWKIPYDGAEEILAGLLSGILCAVVLL